MRMDMLLASNPIASRKASGPSDEQVIIKDGESLMQDGGKFVLSEEAAGKIVAAFEASDNDIMVDYEHALVIHAAKGNPAPAAGWITSLRYAKGRGLVASIEWTDEARSRIKKKEYRYSSPVVRAHKDTGEISEFINLAITNAPLTVGAPELVAASRLIAASRETSIMAKDDAPVVSLAGIAQRLGLQDTADETLILSELDKLKGHVGYVSADEYKKLSEKVAELQSAEQERKADEAVGRIVAANKLNPNDAERMKWAKDFARRDLAGFETIMAGAPALVDASRVVASGGRTPAPADDRKTIIASAANECRASGWMDRLSGGLASWVNDSLRVKGLAAMTDDEQKNLATIGG